jgi:hypothetical protein
MEEAAEPHQKAVIAVLMAAGADLPKELARLSLDPEGPARDARGAQAGGCSHLVRNGKKLP